MTTLLWGPTVLPGDASAFVFDNNIAVSIGYEVSACVGEIALDWKHPRPIFIFHNAIFIQKYVRCGDKNFQCDEYNNVPGIKFFFV